MFVVSQEWIFPPFQLNKSMAAVLIEDSPYNKLF